MKIEEVSIPSTINSVTSVLSLRLSSRKLVNVDRCNIIFSHCKWGEPLPMMVLGREMRAFVRNNPHVSFFVVTRNTQFVGYADHVGFFRYCGFARGNETGEALGSSTYVPIQIIRIDDWKSEAPDARYADVVEERASELAHILTQRRGVADFMALQYSLREILRNSVEHSMGELVSFFAQYWKNKKPPIAEIVIWDNGCGLRETLTQNFGSKVASDREALHLSIQPGVSGVTEREREHQPEDIRNSGFGLYTTSRFASESGLFRMISGSAGITVNDSSIVNHDWRFQGTCVQIKLKLDEIGNVSERIARIIAEGEAVFDGATGRVASAASRTFSKWLGDEKP